VQGLFLKHYPKEKQDGFRYTQGSRGHKQGREKGGRDRFEREDRDNLSMWKRQI